MAGVLQTSQPLGERFTLPASNAPGNLDVIVVDASAAIAAQQLAVGLVPAWFVDATNGSDSNDGRTAQTAFKTSEKLSQTLCPGGLICTFSQTTVVNFAAGAYGALELFVDWISSIGTFGAHLSINCAFTSTAPMPLTAVTNTAPGVARGQLTVSSGAFTAKKRIRSLNGANTGAYCYSTGQNASPQNHFVSKWYNYNAGLPVNIANGTTVCVDTLAVSFNKVIIETRDAGYVEMLSAQLLNGANITDWTFNFLMYFAGCELTGGLFGSYSAEACRIVGDVRHSYGFGFFQSCVVQARLSAIQGGFMEIGSNGDGGCVDGGNLIAGNHIGTLGTSGGLCSINVLNAIEWENGTATDAVTLAPGGFLSTLGLFWGLSGAWARGFVLQSGANAVTTTVANLAIPATQPMNLTGHNLAYAAVPLGYPRANCSFAINPDPAAVAVSI